MVCPECYSNNPRITPLTGVQECLQYHKQYICSTCGRCICATVDTEGVFRSGYPFKTLEFAVLYLKAAETINSGPCKIYEMEYSDGRRFYKIFKTKDDLDDYLKHHPNQELAREAPFRKSKDYSPSAEDNVRMLTREEIDKYIEERTQMGVF